jgi:hypothetical protein
MSDVTFISEGAAWLNRFGPERPSEAEEKAELIRLEQDSYRALKEYQALVAHGMDKKQAFDRSKLERAETLLQTARKIALKGFATERGWTIGEQFTLRDLRGWRLRDWLPVGRLALLEPTYLWQNGKPVAIVSACWPSQKSQCVEIAGIEGLRVEELPYSLYATERAVGLLFCKA